MKCAFCNKNNTIENSHVVSKFLINHIKRNSPTKYLFNSWSPKKQQDGIKGAYLCAECDNIIFSQWENNFKRKVFDNLDKNIPIEFDEDSIKFILSIVFRYSEYFFVTSIIDSNHENHTRFKELAFESLHDLKLINKKIFIYPYFFTPIIEGCEFIPGINHLLNLAFNAQSLPAEAEDEELPNAFFLLLPSMVFLVTDSELCSSSEARLNKCTSIDVGVKYQLHDINTNMVHFLKVIFQRILGQTKTHQKNTLFKKINYGIDKLKNPNKLCYKCQSWDSKLKKWQIDKKC